MMKSKQITTILGCLALAFGLTQAQTPISFDLQAIQHDDVTRQITAGGVTATFTALNNWQRDFNFTGNAKFKTSDNHNNYPIIGYNNPSYPYNGAKFSVSFDKKVHLRSMQIYATQENTYYDDDKLKVTVQGESTNTDIWLEIGTDGDQRNVVPLATVVEVEANQIVQFEHFNTHLLDDGAPNDWNNGLALALEKLNVELIPEPTTYAFLLGLGALGFAAYRRRRQ